MREKFAAKFAEAGNLPALTSVGALTENLPDGPPQRLMERHDTVSLDNPVLWLTIWTIELIYVLSAVFGFG